jgi:N-acyl-D-amino-acid deacylase
MGRRWLCTALTAWLAAGCGGDSGPLDSADGLEDDVAVEADGAEDEGADPGPDGDGDAEVPPDAGPDADADGAGDVAADADADADAPDDDAAVVPPVFPTNPFDKGAVTLELTGTGMAEFDDRLPSFMVEHRIPNLAFAVVKDGRLVVARGYSYVHDGDDLIIDPSARFRIASIAKTLTSAAILKLVEEGRLSLDESAFARLTTLPPLSGATEDPRLAGITIRQLLTHSGGWDRDVSFDPMFRPVTIARAVGVPAPAGAADIVRYMRGQPLDFDPGARYAYSNFGYCVLGRVIEAVTGRGYEEYVTSEILAPMGVTRIRQGRTLFPERLADEPYYFDLDSHDALGAEVFDSIDYNTPGPYGGFALEPMDSHGGWIASAPDLLRFVNHHDGRAPPPDLLAAATLATMIERPGLPDWVGTTTYYALGWKVQPTSTDAYWFHGGSLNGTRTVLVRATTGRAWVALTNARSYVDDFGPALETLVWEGFGAVTAWPAHDLFPTTP